MDARGELHPPHHHRVGSSDDLVSRVVTDLIALLAEAARSECAPLMCAVNGK